VRPSLAVLPFQNTSGDSADEHFADGLTDELIGALGKVTGLRTAGRTSAFALKGTRLGLRAVAETLGVGAVLEGSVRRDGGRLKIGAQLVSAADGAVLWTETYDREPASVFAVQEEIARAIVGALRVHLGATGAPHVRRATMDSAAYDLYLKGRYVLRTQQGRGVVQAVGYFEQAVARDSSYAAAFSGLSDAYTRLALFGYAPPRETFAKATAAARRALALDSTLAEAHVSLGHVRMLADFARADAEREFRIALALDPSYAFARAPYAINLASVGRYDEAIAQLDTVRASDPLALTILNLLGRIYVAAGRPDDAIAIMRQSLELDPRADLAYEQLGHAYLLTGRPAEAIAAFRRAAALSGPRDSAQLAYAYAVTGQRAEAERVLRTLVAPSHPGPVLSYHIAMAYAGLGDRDAAFRWLDRGYAEHTSFIGWVRADPGFARLHADPRWPLLLRRMGLPP
jgi:TolB-like protein/Flp pilus assembly protein TadD